MSCFLFISFQIKSQVYYSLMDTSDNNVRDNRQSLNQLKKKMCHGNRRDQRFRRKCRARGMKPEEIAKLLNKHKQIEKKKNRRIHHITSVTSKNTETTTTVSNKVPIPRSDSSKQVSTMNSNLNKRKRDASLYELKSKSVIPKSTSSISIVQSLSKKMKKKQKTTMNPIITEYNSSINKNYRLVLYFIFYI